MKANAVPLLKVFESKLRLEVPLFQRQYVWKREQQWEPLWEDISRKFIEGLEDRSDAPPHFLGAMVLDQKQTPTTHVEKRQVIDGQQRLITLQIFLSVFRDFCKEQNCDDLANECDSFVLNKGMMIDPAVEKFKVWPTQLDRDQFADVVTASSRSALEKKHPLVYLKWHRKPEPRPRMVDVYVFFYNQLSEFFLGAGSEKPLASDQVIASRLEKCFQALKNALQVVVIDLDQGDDAQVIFETLNARGEPLLPADLLRNFVFLRAFRQGESQEELYDQYWRKFDDPFWRREIRQGRLIRPRSDLFLQHFLASRQMTDIPIKHLYVEYKFWIEKKHPFPKVREELQTLSRQGDDFRRLIDPRKDDKLFPLATFLDRFDTSTAYPLLLFLLDAKLGDSEWMQISTALESYVLRRAICGFTTKGYNRTFLSLARFLQQKSPTIENVRKYLASLQGESALWPTDETFAKAWQNTNAYLILDNSRIVYVLRRLSDSYLSGKTEQISIDSPLTVEHIMPQNWLDNWPMRDGSKGLTTQQLWEVEREEGAPEDPRVAATNRRNSLLHTLGNLTILTQPLNSAVSNGAWAFKKPELLKSSLLPINQQLFSYTNWDEEAIETRSKQLFEMGKSIWTGPSHGGETDRRSAI